MGRFYPNGLWCNRYGCWCDDVVFITDGERAEGEKMNEWLLLGGIAALWAVGFGLMFLSLWLEKRSEKRREESDKECLAQLLGAAGSVREDRVAYINDYHYRRGTR